MSEITEAQLAQWARLSKSVRYASVWKVGYNAQIADALDVLVHAARDPLKDAVVEAAKGALVEIRHQLDLRLPSEQTGPEWERCVRVPVARMAAIDALLASVLGEPAHTNEPKPALHPEEPVRE